MARRWRPVFALLAALGCSSRGPARGSLPALPGAEPFEPALVPRLLEASARHAGEKPHTRHLLPTGQPRYTNRLILESSPYLLQHAHNPVNWYAWGDQAFAAARRRGVPILLSIGYSTCHWCHVMEEESFEDEEIATFLNAHYVAIKVDREERPDLDEVYMAVVQQMTGSGGWPMTLWLTSERKPVFAATYLPPREGMRGAGVGFLTLLRALREAYGRDPAGFAARGREVAAQLEVQPGPKAAGVPGPEAIRAAVTHLESAFDREWGGFGRAAKFPHPSALELLLRYHRRTGEAAALESVTVTLDRMARGGIYDQLGGGFHRYSTDRKWLVPHFEKMLYDQARLAMVYLEAYQAAARPDFAAVARETLAYLERELRAPGGGFLSATDADSAGGEGAYFAWTPDQIDAVLGRERGRLVRAYYDVTPQGNFAGGSSVLWRPGKVDQVAAEARVASTVLIDAVSAARPLLLAARARRPAPETDRKVLVAWNALALSAFARAALVLGDAADLAVARRVAEALLAGAAQGSALRHSLDGGAAFLDDYAYLVQGLLDLYEADGSPRWLAEAKRLQAQLDRDFGDPAGGYFFTSSRHEVLLVRSKPDFDGALPTGNAVAALALERLAELTGNDDYRKRAQALLEAFSDRLATDAVALPHLLEALDFRLDRVKEIVIVVPPGESADALKSRLRRIFLPNRVLLVTSQPDQLAQIAPIAADKVALGGRATAYVCEATRCELPTTDPDRFERQLRKVEPLPLGSGDESNR